MVFCKLLCSLIYTHMRPGDKQREKQGLDHVYWIEDPYAAMSTSGFPNHCRNHRMSTKLSKCQIHWFYESTNYPSINTMSSYSHSGRSDGLGNEKRTEKVMKICRCIGYDIDRGIASHVKIRLAAYFVEKIGITFEGIVKSEEAKELRELMPPNRPD